VNEPTTNPLALPAATLEPSRAGPGTLRDRVRSLQLPDDEGRGRGGFAWLPWTLCLLLAGGAGFLGYQLYAADRVVQELKDAAAAEASKAVKGTAPPAGKSATPVAAAGEVVLESKGYIIPAHQIQVSPLVNGRILKLDIEEGKRVRKGEVLAEMEKVEYQAEVDRAKAALENALHKLALLRRSHPQEIRQAEAELAESEAQVKQLRLEWERTRRLMQSGGNAVAAREYEQAESSFRAMERRAERLRLAVELMKTGPRIDQIRAAEAEVRQAEATLTLAAWRLDNCTIRAPVTGTILKKNAEEGNIVNPVAFNISATLCDMADLADLEVELNVQERDIARVFKDQKCKVRAEAFPDRTYEGFVSRLMPIADRAKGAVPVRVKLAVPREEEGVFLKPEMGAVVSFLKKSDS
jgi:HlyD family secretion protein